jgi:hypothetical protein
LFARIFRISLPVYAGDVEDPLTKSKVEPKTLPSAERAGPLPTVGIMFEQKPVSILTLEEYRLFDRNHWSVNLFILLFYKMAINRKDPRSIEIRLE